MSDDKIRERHGMLCLDNSETKNAEIIITERTTGKISISASMTERRMTPVQARYLARKLYRLARRIDSREWRDIATLPSPLQMG